MASIFLPGEFHGLYSPWCHKELDTTVLLSLPLVVLGRNRVFFFRVNSQSPAKKLTILDCFIIRGVYFIMDVYFIMNVYSHGFR